MICFQLSSENSHEHGYKLKFKEIGSILIQQQLGLGGELIVAVIKNQFYRYLRKQFDN